MTDEEIAGTRRIAGYVLLGSAGLVWLTAIMLSPHGEAAPTGVEHVKASVALFARNASLGILALILLAAAALFWKRRPQRRAADLVPLALMALLAASSFYQLVWIETEVLDVDTQGATASDRT